MDRVIELSELVEWGIDRSRAIEIQKEIERDRYLETKHGMEKIK
jgi:hypothetical protein